MSDATRWFQALFREGEVFEVRTRNATDRGVGWRNWMVMGRDDEKFVQNVIPVSHMNRRDVWVGVCPRTAIGSSAPSLARVVWVDCDGVSEDEVKQSLWDLGLPPASMAVNSGHGVHVYWLLHEDVPPEDIRPVTRWLSRNVRGADGVAHDPTRILRVPGTTNFKGEPVECRILWYSPSTLSRLEDFPRLEQEIEDLMTPTIGTDILLPDDREKLVDIWVEGQRHQAALAIAGFARKDLGYDARGALALLRGIHYERGGVRGDENDIDIERVVATTFKKPPQLVKGALGLAELGVTFDAFRVEIARPPAHKVRMGLIDFSRDLQEQEFWVDGFIGPGLLTMIAAQPKAGKSLVAMQIGHALANGLQVFDFDTTPKRRRVLYFQGELSQGMVYSRARDMFPPGTYEDAAWFGMTDKPDKVLDLVTDPEPLYDLAEHYDVVIIDPLSVFNANDENSVVTVRETLSVFDTLKAQGKAVLLVHHTKKLDSTRDGKTVTPSVSDVRGSGAWFAAVDALGIMYQHGEQGNARMKFVFRAAPEREELNLFRLPHGGFTSDRNAYLRVLGATGLRVGLPVGPVN